MIRKIRESDVKLLAEVKKIFPEAYSENVLSSSIKSGRFFGFISKDKDGLCGYITYSVSMDGADIDTVFVEEKNRKNGLATNLILLTEKDVKSRGLNFITLEVKDKNFPAISLYQKLGYKKIAERKKYYKDGNALIYRKEL